MNKCSGYILKHILSFIPRSKLHIIRTVGGTLGNIVCQDVSFTVDNLYHKWADIVSLQVLKEQKDFLDIMQRPNGKYVFFTLDFRVGYLSKSGIAQIIVDNSPLFIDFCQLIGAKLSIPDNKFSVDYSNIDIGNINHKYLVAPCRMHMLNIGGDARRGNCYASDLYYYKYLEIEDDYDEANDDDHYNHKIDGVRCRYDFYNYLASNYPDLVRENSITILKKCALDMNNSSRDNLTYFDHMPGSNRSTRSNKKNIGSEIHRINVGTATS